jgi:uncharacterized membrane protein
LDELASWWFARSLSTALRAEATNPPLYYVLLHSWMNWFGTSETALRSLSVLPGIASIWVVWRLGSVLLSEQAGLVAAAYQAISSFQLHYSREARTFSWLVFFILSASLMLWHALARDSARRWQYYGAYILFMALALYSHFIAVFFLGGHVLFVLLARRRQLVPFGVSVAGVILLFAPWLLTLLRGTVTGGRQDRRYLLLKLPQAYFSFLLGDTLIPLDESAVTSIGKTLLHYSPLLVGAVASATVIGVFVLRAWRRSRDSVGFAVVLGVAPVLAAWLISFRVMVFDERYLAPAAPFLYLLVGAAVIEITRLGATRGLDWRTVTGYLGAGLFASLVVLSTLNYHTNPRFGKEQWREAVAVLEEYSRPTDLVVFDPDYIAVGYLYYQKRSSLPYWPIPKQYVETEMRPARVREKTHGHDRIWLVRSHHTDDTVLTALRERFSQTALYSFSKAKGVELMLLEPKIEGAS